MQQGVHFIHLFHSPGGINKTTISMVCKPSEINHSRKPFRQNYSYQDIAFILKKAISAQVPLPKMDPKGWVFIPYYSSVPGRIDHVLQKCGIKCIPCPPVNIKQLLHSVKEGLEHLEGVGSLVNMV